MAAEVVVYEDQTHLDEYEEVEAAILEELLQEAEVAALEQELSDHDPDPLDEDSTVEEPDHPLSEESDTSSHEESSLLDFSETEVDDVNGSIDLDWVNLEVIEVVEEEVFEEFSDMENLITDEVGVEEQDSTMITVDEEELNTEAQELLGDQTEDKLETLFEENEVHRLEDVVDFVELEHHDDFIEPDDIEDVLHQNDLEEIPDVEELAQYDEYTELEEETSTPDELFDLEEIVELQTVEQEDLTDLQEIKEDEVVEEDPIDNLEEQFDEKIEEHVDLDDFEEQKEESEESSLQIEEQLEEPDEDLVFEEQQPATITDASVSADIETLEKEFSPVSDEYQSVFTPHEQFVAHFMADMLLFETIQTEQERNTSSSTISEKYDLPSISPYSVSFNEELLPPISLDHFDREVSTLDEELALLNSPRAFQHFHEQLQESHLQLLTIDPQLNLDNLTDNQGLVSQSDPLPDPPPYDFLAELESYEEDETQHIRQQFHNPLYPYSKRRFERNNTLIKNYDKVMSKKIIKAATKASQTIKPKTSITNSTHPQNKNQNSSRNLIAHNKIQSIAGVIPEEIKQNLSRLSIAKKYKYINAKKGKGGGGGGIHPDLLIKWEKQLKICGKYLHQTTKPSGTIQLDELSNAKIKATFKVEETVISIKFERITDDNFDQIVVFLSQASAFSPFLSKKIESYYSKKEGRDVFVIQKPRHGPLTSIISVSNSYKKSCVTLKIDTIKIGELKREISDEITRRAILFELKMKGYPTSILKKLDESWVKTLATWSRERVEGEIQTKKEIYHFFKHRARLFSIKNYSHDFNQFKDAIFELNLSDGFSAVLEILKTENPSDMSLFKDLNHKYAIRESRSLLLDSNKKPIAIEKVLGLKIMEKIKDGMVVDPTNEIKNSSLVFDRLIESYRINSPKNCPLVNETSGFGLDLQKFKRGDYIISTEFSSGSKYFDLFSPDMIIRDKSIQTDNNPKGIIVGVFDQKGRTSDLSIHQPTASIYEIFDLLLITVVTNKLTGFIHQEFKEEGGEKLIKYTITTFNPHGKLQEVQPEIEKLLVESVYYRYARRAEIINDVYHELGSLSDNINLHRLKVRDILSTKLNDLEKHVERAINKNDEIYNNGGNEFKQLFSKYNSFADCKNYITESLMKGVLKDPKKLSKMSEYQFRGEWQRNILRGDLLTRFKEKIQTISTNSKKDR